MPRTLTSNLPSNIATLGRTIRNIRRAKEILGVLASFGFGQAIVDLDLDRLVLRGRRMIGLSKPDASVTRKPTAVRLREAAEELGPTFVKLAQVLSTRPDLIPPEWAEEFAKLQSTVRPVPADEIKPYLDELIERMPETGDEGPRFHRIEYEAMAAGSIAQAHRATLAGGGEVILKVLRPDIEEIIEADLEIMATLAEFIEDRFSDLGYSPIDVVEQFRRQVRREIDLELERRSMARMAASFTEDDRVTFPKVYPQHSTPEVLCMEHVKGTLLSDFKKDGDHKEGGRFTEDQRREIVAIGTDVVFRQCFEIGFFHADPHPGNLFVLIDPAMDASGEGEAGALAKREAPDVRLCFIDYGMTGNIDPRTAEVLADLVQGTIAGDLDRVLDVVIELTGVSPMKAHDRAFRADAWEFISRFQSASLADLRMGALLSEFFAKLRKHKLRVPADIVYLIKAITTIEGVGEMVCPNFDIVDHVRPHVEGLLRRRYGFRAAKRRVQGAVVGYAELMERAPREVASILHMVRNEELGVQLKHHGLSEVTDELERASRNISYSLVVAALVVGGSIMLLADRAAASRGATDAPEGLLFWIGLAAFVFAGLLGVIRLLFGKRLSS